MYVNKCSKCGVEFETKNPKRVICPSCLYPDRKPILSSSNESKEPEQKDRPQSEDRPRPSYPPRSDYRRPQGDRPSYNRESGRPPYNREGSRPPYNREGGRPPYNRDGPRPPFNREGGRPPYNRDGSRPPFNRDGGRPPFNRGPRKPAKSLLISKEQVAQIEELYRKALPLPNPDIHEVIGSAIDLEPNKVFFGINLVRQKMKLPKLPYPKRKLAVSPDQMQAVQSLYEPLLPTPPIGCHKILAAQLKMDEWRVHVAIGLVRKQMNLPRWNTERDDIPEKHKKQAEDNK